MSKEIKYEVWDYENKVMGFFPNEDTKVEIKDFRGLVNVYDFDYILQNKHKYKLREYIGRDDKNGRCIYDGDICEINDLYCNMIKVEWYKLGFRGIGKEHHAISSDGQFPNNGYDISSYELNVIGNIYKNPELMEKL